MLRRFAGLALMAVFAHLTVARAQLACADEGRHPSPPAESAHHTDMSGHDGHAGHTPDTTEKDECETPVQPQCCQALASCTGTSDAAEPCGTGALPERSGLAAGHLMGEPRSRIAAPEPPPPRA